MPNRTLATQVLMQQVGRTPRKRRAKRKAKKRATRARAKTRTKRRTKRRTKKRAHLVKGSAAAKRHMAKLRRMQKRR